jgi:small-conductance mechanosensitive channel
VVTVVTLKTPGAFAGDLIWPIHAAIVVVVAVVVRWAVHRLIDRLTNTVVDNSLARRFARTRAGATILARDERAVARHESRSRTIASLLKSLTSIVVMTLALISFLSAVGINVAPVLASAGIVGIAIGFGAQSLIRDFLTGIFMILEDQFGVGDSVDMGVAAGVVEDVGLRITRIRDDQGVVWYLPNGQITRVGNKTQGWALATIDIPLPYGQDVERALQVVTDTVELVAAEPPLDDQILDEPPGVTIASMTDVAVVIRAQLRTRPLHNGTVADVMRRRVIEAFEREGFVSSGPVRDPADDDTSDASGPS